MAILTWRNVDAPNFSGALEGYRTASQLLSNAVKSGQDAVGAYTQANSDAADRAIMNRALGVQGSEEYRNALASGSLVGPDGQNASMKMLGDLDTRTGTLLNRDVARENLGQTQYTNQRGQQGDALMDAAGPDVALARTLARNNDQETLNKLLQTSPTLQKLRPEQLASLLTGVDALSTSFQGRRSSDTTFGQGQWRFGNEVRDSTDAQVAQAAWLEIQRDNATPEDVQAAVNQRAGSMSPGAQARLINAAKGAGINVNAPVGSGASGGAGVASSGAAPAGGVDGTFSASIPFAETRNYVTKITGNAGDLSGLTNAQKLEKLVPLVLNQESGNRRYDAQGKLIQGPVTRSGERAQGEMQVMPATSRDPGYGVKPAKDNSPDEAARVGRDYLSAMLNKYNGNVDQALAAYNAGPGTVDDWLKNKDPAAALKNEVMSRAGNNLGADIARQQIQERAGQNQAVGIFPELNALQADRRAAVEVVDSLTKEGGVFAGSDRGELVDIVNSIVQRSGNRINPAMAAEMVARNVESADGLFVRGWSKIADVAGTPFGRRWSTPNMEGGVRINDRGVNQMVDEYLAGGTSTRRTAQQGVLAEDQALESLRTRYNDADTLYRELRSQSKSRPGLSGNLALYEQKRDAAAEALRRAIESASKRKSLVPNFDRPVAPSRTGKW